MGGVWESGGGAIREAKRVGERQQESKTESGRRRERNTDYWNNRVRDLQSTRTAQWLVCLPHRGGGSSILHCSGCLPAFLSVCARLNTCLPVCLNLILLLHIFLSVMCEHAVHPWVHWLSTECVCVRCVSLYGERFPSVVAAFTLCPTHAFWYIRQREHKQKHCTKTLIHIQLDNSKGSYTLYGLFFRPIEICICIETQQQSQCIQVLHVNLCACVYWQHAGVYVYTLWALF